MGKRLLFSGAFFLTLAFVSSAVLVVNCRTSNQCYDSKVLDPVSVLLIVLNFAFIFMGVALVCGAFCDPHLIRGYKPIIDASIPA